jgi:release factor glutamine methyltransferase
LTIAEAIYQAAQKLDRSGIDDARLDAEVLLSHILGKDRGWLLAHSKDRLDQKQAKFFEGSLERRARHEPLQYIIGTQEFWGLEFTVSPDVLIPRPETELIVETAINIIRAKGTEALIVDLCTGSGCIAVSLAKELGDARIFAVDTSGQALAIARKNSQRHGVSARIRFLEGDLYAPLEELDICSRVDVITANPPYIRSGDMPMLQPEVRDYEPKLALIAGADGTDVQRAIIGRASDFLKDHGTLIMEMGMGQAQALTRMVDETGSYDKPEILKDLAGIDRVLVARRK